MPNIEKLVIWGGDTRDFHVCGTQIRDILQREPRLEVTYIEEDWSSLEASNLAPYDLLVLYCTGRTLADSQKTGLLNWVASGNGFVGIHSATVSFTDCPDYLAMLGGRFLEHPSYRQYQVSVTDPDHPITQGIEEFMVTDEQYILDYDPRVQVLCSALYRGEAMPVAWLKSWGDGQVYYLALGHDPEACQNEHFQLLLRRGALYVAGGQLPQ